MEKNFFNKFSWVIFASILMTLNITQVVVFSDSIKFNMALSDLFIPIFVLISLFYWKRYGFNQTYMSIGLWLGLAAWLFLVAFLAIRNATIFDGGWNGLFEELIKTGLCVLYFFVGYNTLRALKLGTFKIMWSLSTLLFVIGGFVIYILALKGLFFWSDDPRYMRMFMGTDTDPNHAATFLTLSFFGMGVFAILSERIGLRGFYYLVMLISSIGLIFTGSRGGIFGFVIGIAVLLIYYVFKNWRVALALTLVLILMSMVFITIDHFYLENVFTHRLLYKFVEIESGFNIRANLSRVAWMMGVEHPMFGVGRGNYILNSPNYFEQLGVNYIEDIPHNTYFGLVAETGIIGLILFCMPFFLFVHTIIRRYKRKLKLFKEEENTLIWIAAGVLALGVQAAVLNVENRRFLWYLAGVLIFIFETDSILKIKQSFHLTIKRLNLSLIAILIITIAFSTFAIKNVYMPYQPKVIVQNYVYEIPFEDYNLDNLYTVGIKLLIGVNEDQTDRVVLSIVEVADDGTKVVLDTFTYDGANGIVMRSFKPTMKNSNIFIKAHKLDQSLKTFSILPVFLRVNEEVFELTRWYFLQPSMITRITLEKNKLLYDDWVTKTDLSLGLNKTFDSQLSVESVSVSQLEDAYTEITVKIQVLKDFNVNVIPTLRGYPSDLHLMEEDRIASGLEGYVLKEPIETSTWKVGELYNLVFKIPRQNGIYELKMGFYELIEDKAVYLNVDNLSNSKLNLLDLGWLNLDEFTEGITYE